MLSWMANVHGHLMKYGEDGSVPEYPRMFCIGTRGDLLSDEKKKQVISELVSHYQSKDYARLMSDTLIIDNTSSGKGELYYIYTSKFCGPARVSPVCLTV